jgi:hypothetical protein
MYEALKNEVAIKLGGPKLTALLVVDMLNLFRSASAVNVDGKRPPISHPSILFRFCSGRRTTLLGCFGGNCGDPERNDLSGN